MLPLQRCTSGTHPGDVGRHIHTAVANCTNTNNRAALLTQAFICSTPEKPRSRIGLRAGVWKCAYKPNDSATTNPTPSIRATTSGRTLREAPAAVVIADQVNLLRRRPGTPGRRDSPPQQTLPTA